MVVCVHTHQEVRHMLSPGNSMNGVVISIFPCETTISACEMNHHFPRIGIFIPLKNKKKEKYPIFLRTHYLNDALSLR